MATPESIAIRRADALDRSHAALKRIGEALDLDLGTYPEPHRDFEMRPAVESEWLAGTLEAVADELDPDGSKGDEIARMKRAELNAYALELGIEDPGKLPNKTAVMAAIRALDAETAPTRTDESDQTDELTSSEEGIDEMSDPRVPTPEEQPEPTPTDEGGADSTDDAE